MVSKTECTSFVYTETHCIHFHALRLQRVTSSFSIRCILRVPRARRSIRSLVITRGSLAIIGGVISIAGLGLRGRAVIAFACSLGLRGRAVVSLAGSLGLRSGTVITITSLCPFGLRGGRRGGNRHQHPEERSQHRGWYHLYAISDTVRQR